MSVQVKGTGTIGGLDEGLVVSGIVTSSTQVNVGSNIKLGNAGVVTATSFVGSGANLTSLPAQATIANNADNRVITGGSGVNLNGEANLTFNGTKLSVAGTGAIKIPVGTTGERPSAVAGDIRYNTTSTSLEFYTGSAWIGTNVAPTINSVTGTIYYGISTTLVINASDISASGNTVRYSNHSNGSVIATDSGASTSGLNITSTVPANVYNTAAGTVIRIEVLNSSGIPSQNNNTKTIISPPSGGSITNSGSYRIHSFTSSGTFVVPSGLTLSNVEYLVVAGGGGGGGSAQGHQGGGGGAGGLRTSLVGATSGRNSSAESRVTFTAGSYGVSVGGGGVGRASGAG